MVKTINANSVYDRPIRIGYEGENIVTAITFNLAMWIEEFGTGAAVLLVQRNGDGNAYPVPLTIEDGLATWEITSTDCAKQGRGAIQIVYTAGEQVKKSPIFTIVCSASIEGSDSAPDPYESWLATLTELTATTETNAQRAEDAAERAEEAAEGGGGGEGGADGFSPVATVEQTENGAVITITDKAGTTTATVTNGATGPQGPKGDTGATGPAGSDATVTAENIAAALGYTPVSGDVMNVTINESFAVPSFFACDAYTKAVLDQITGGNASIALPSDFSNLQNLLYALEPRKWFAWLNGTELEFARLGVSINVSTQAATLCLKGRTSTATGIMGIDTTWTVTPISDFTDTYKNKVDGLWSDYQSALTAMGL